MDFTIYTAGSVEFLEMMLNATAMVTGSGTTEDIARIGALIGLLLVVFQAVFSGQPIGFQKPALMLVIYAMFYGPAVTVVIEDTVASQARVVDNVPLGPAFVGSTISTVAHGIAQTMEQATSLPGMTGYGLFGSLQTISAIRDTLRNPTSLDAYNNYGQALGKDLPRTFRAHMTYCVGNPSELDTTPIEERYRMANSVGGGYLGAIHSFRESQYSYVYDGTEGAGVPAFKTCRESSEFISRAYAEILPDLMQEILMKGFSSAYKQGQIVNGGQLMMNAQEAIDALAITSKSAQEYVVTSALISNFENGRAEALQHWHGSRAAVALRDSLNQQELQWAGRGDVFKHYMRPMISFFEGLLYAITPFMAFALMLGSTGTSILAKYLVLPLAVGLWLPLLSIVNAFTLWYAGAQMDPILSGYDPTSTGFAISQITDLDHAVSKALGVGGLLASSVPALALFLVSGSAYVANSIMSNMTSGDKFRSEDITPRVQDSSPSLATNSMYTADHTTDGVSRTGTREKSVQFSGTQAAEASVQSAQAKASESMETYSEKLGSAMTQAISTGTGQQHISNVGKQTMTSLDMSSDSGFQQARSTLRTAGYSEEQIQAGAATASAGLGFKFGATWGGQFQDTEQMRNMSSEQRQEVENAMATAGNSVTARTSSADVFQAGESFSNGVTSQMGISNTDELSKTASIAQKDSETYQKAMSSKDAIAGQQSLDLKQAAFNALAGGAGVHGSHANAARNAEERFFDSPEDRQMLANNLASVRESGISSNDAEQRMAAMALTMHQQGRFGEMVNSEYNPFMISPVTGDAHQNAGLADVAAPNLQNRFEANRAENSAAINGVAGNSGHAELRERASGTIDAADASNQGAVLGHRAASEAYLADQDRPGTVELDHIRTTEPVANYFREGANQTGESFKSFGDGISDLKSRFTGEDHGDLSPVADPRTGEVWESDVPPSWAMPGPDNTLPPVPAPERPAASLPDSAANESFPRSPSINSVVAEEPVSSRSTAAPAGRAPNLND